MDYLVEEVLRRQPERVRSFLLQTSILERLSGPLCDAVTDQETTRCWRLWSEETCSSFRSTIDATGFATITSLRTFSARA